MVVQASASYSVRLLMISASLFFVAGATSAQAVPVKPAPLPVASLVNLTHGGHSICYAGHRHDWEARKIRCYPEEYIFKDGPLPLRSARKRMRKHK